MKVFAVDPGNKQSAYVVWDGEQILEKAKLDNRELLYRIYEDSYNIIDILAIEQIRSYGMAVGDTIFETVWWSGRFCEAWDNGEFHRIPRMDVKMHLCNSSRAKDGNIRQALIDRFEPDLQPRKKPKGILKGVSADIWAALAVAVYFYDTQMKEK